MKKLLNAKFLNSDLINAYHLFAKMDMDPVVQWSGKNSIIFERQLPAEIWLKIVAFHSLIKFTVSCTRVNTFTK